MMNMLEEAVIYATIMYQGRTRKFSSVPFILHPMEVAQILATMTTDQEMIAAGMLHDIEGAEDWTLSEIEKRFGKRVSFLVSSDLETKTPGEDPKETWKKRKEDSIRFLKNCKDVGVQMLWLADKLANLRSLAGEYSERGEAMWQELNQSDPAMQLWYYRTIAETVELNLNRTGAFKEFIKHINFIWPGTFDSEKARYKKYREVSVEGCKLLGRGAKGEVYRYDDELVIKVFNQNNTYHDVEREIGQSRRAFILGVPTAISFGIVTVGEKYGAMYELVEAETMSNAIARAPGQAEAYAKIMAELARTIHGTTVSEDDGFPPASDTLREYVAGSVACYDEALAARCKALIDALPETGTLIHGDFHTGNVFLQKGEPLLIDMDRLSTGHPIAEIAGLYYFYVVLGEDDPSVVEKFMGFSYETAQRFFRAFLTNYLGTEDPERLREVTDKAALVAYTRQIRKYRKKGTPPPEVQARIDAYLKKIAELAGRLDSLAF